MVTANNETWPFAYEKLPQKVKIKTCRLRLALAKCHVNGQGHGVAADLPIVNYYNVSYSLPVVPNLVKETVQAVQGGGDMFGHQ